MSGWNLSPVGEMGVGIPPKPQNQLLWAAPSLLEPKAGVRGMLYGAPRYPAAGLIELHWHGVEPGMAKAW